MAATATSTDTATVARELVTLCNAGRNLDAIEKFYSPDIVSTESMGSEEMPAQIHGIEAVRGKNQWWVENNEIHSAKATGPFIGDGQFAVRFDYDTTFKPTGQRVDMTEMALYDVADGKIVREHFFYHMPG
jgi:ketosteroid isomerase-like protein